jgi:hypothetical protein
VTRQTTTASSFATSERTASTAKVDNQTETATVDTTTVDFATNATDEATFVETTTAVDAETTTINGGQDLDDNDPAAATEAVAAVDIVPSVENAEDETGGATVTISPSKLVFDTLTPLFRKCSITKFLRVRIVVASS